MLSNYFLPYICSLFSIVLSLNHVIYTCPSCFLCRSFLIYLKAKQEEKEYQGPHGTKEGSIAQYKEKEAALLSCFGPVECV